MIKRPVNSLKVRCQVHWYEVFSDTQTTSTSIE